MKVTSTRNDAGQPCVVLEPDDTMRIRYMDGAVEAIYFPRGSTLPTIGSGPNAARAIMDVFRLLTTPDGQP